jgi:hypothetical protein
MSDSAPPRALLSRLSESSSAADAAEALLGEPGWLTGTPPAEVLTALGDPEQAAEGPIVDLACLWERGALVAALMRAIDGEGDLSRRRRLAWMAKQAPSVNALPALLTRARAPDEDRVVRRYALETIMQLAFAEAVGWPNVEETVRFLSRESDPSLREAAIALAASCEGRSIERRELFTQMLSDSSPEVVANAAIALKGYGVSASDIEPALLARLLGHANPLVRLSVEELMAGSGLSRA